jgi:hypothetical protein
MTDEDLLGVLADGPHDWAVHVEVIGDAGDVVDLVELQPGQARRLIGSTVRVVTGGVIPAIPQPADPGGGEPR